MSEMRRCNGCGKKSTLRPAAGPRDKKGYERIFLVCSDGCAQKVRTATDDERCGLCDSTAPDCKGKCEGCKFCCTCALGVLSETVHKSGHQARRALVGK